MPPSQSKTGCAGFSTYLPLSGGGSRKRFDHSRAQTSRARRLRRDMTEVEKKLRWRLRGEQLEYAFRRQHPVGPHVLDFYCAPLRVAIEVDGHRQGTDEVRSDDQRRDAFLAEAGICTIRFANHEVMENLEAVLETIWNKLQELSGNASRSLPLKGGGEEGADQAPGRQDDPTR